MPFIRLNGISIPVASGRASRSHITSGHTERTLHGRYRENRRFSKRKWEFSTPPLEEVEAKALIGLIRGEGQIFHFNSKAGDFAAVDQGNSKGTYPISSISYGHRIWGTAADGNGSIYDSNGELEALFGADGCVQPSPAVTNLLATNVSDGTETSGDTTGWTTVGSATLSSDTSFFVNGTRSLKVICSVTDDGAAEENVSVTASNTTFSAYIYADTTGSYYIQMNGDVSGSSTQTFTITANRWTRIAFTKGTSSDSTVDCRVRCTAGTSSATFYLDCLQAEDGSILTPWKHSASARTAAGLWYDPSMIDKARALTFNFWSKAASTAPVTNEFFIVASDSVFNQQRRRIQFVRNTLGNLQLTSWYGLSNATATATNPFDGSWHMHTGVINSTATPTKVEIFTDGVSAGTATGTQYNLDLEGWIEEIYVGSDDDSTDHVTSGMQDVMILPYALTEAQILDLYNMGNTDGLAMSNLPNLLFDGDLDFTPSYGIQVQGEVSGVDFVQVGSTALFENNRRIVSFEIQEV